MRSKKELKRWITWDIIAIIIFIFCTVYYIWFKDNINTIHKFIIALDGFCLSMNIGMLMWHKYLYNNKED